MKTRGKNVILFVTLLLTTACSNQTQLTPAQELIKIINAGIEQEVIMLGHQDSPVYGHSWSYEPNRSDVLEMVGDYPAIIGWELGDLEFGNEKNLDGVPFDLMRSEIINQHKRGGINTISWHTNNPNGGNAWDEEAGVVTSILEGGANYEKFQTYLAYTADFLASLTDEDGELIPIIFRPWHEHNGNWFWWGEKWCTHQEYRQLWDMTYDYMTARGLDNLVWCYMPAADAPDKTPEVDRFDMVGIDIYQRNHNVENYLRDLKSGIAMLKEYQAKYNKPITISETGDESVGTENWWSEVLLPAIENEPISYVLLWRNAWDKPEHFYCAYKGHSSEADFIKFVDSPRIITAKELKAITENSK